MLLRRLASLLVWSPAFAGTANWMWFGHDPLGRCVKRWIAPSAGTPGYNPATYYYYEGWSLVQEGSGSSASNATRLYVHGARVDEIVAQITPGNGWQRYFQYDARGHCTLQTDAFGDVAEQYDYDAFGFPYFYDRWGNHMPSSPWGNRFLFTGREWLGDLRTYDYRNRMYQPDLGRFLQPDPIQFKAGDYNLYGYCHNGPGEQIRSDHPVPAYRREVPPMRNSTIPPRIRTSGSTMTGSRCTVIGATIAKATAVSRTRGRASLATVKNLFRSTFIGVTPFRKHTPDID